MLATLNDTKSFLGILDGSKDSLITMLLNMATAYIEKRCGRTFASAVYTSEKYDGTDKSELRLNQYPLIIPPNVILEKNNARDNTDDWEVIDDETYFVDADNGILTLNDFKFILGKKKYRVTYTAGYASIPYDLQYIAMMFVSEVLNKKNALGIKSETLGDHSVTFESVLKNNSESENILNNYRDINI